MDDVTATIARRDRILGIDIARALAILGMVMVHFGPFDPDTTTTAGWIYRTSYGRASMLFVMLAGVGVSLLFRGAHRGMPDAARRRTVAWTKVAWRAVIFLPLGLALQMLPTPVAVILHYYAAYYVVGGLGAMLPTGWLVTLTAGWAVIGPTAYIALFGSALSVRGITDNPLDVVGVVGDILVTGFYPVMTWAPAVLVGVLVGRADLRDRATQWMLVTGGTVVAAAAYGASELARSSSAAAADSPYLLAEGHSGTPLNVVGAVAVAVAVLGASLVLGSLLPRLSFPLVAVGQMALTVYTGHLLVLAVAPEWLEGRSSVEDAVLQVARFFVVTTLLCTFWRWRVNRGPLEWLLALPFESRRGDRPLTPPARNDSWPYPTPPHNPPASTESSTSVPRPSAPPTPSSTSWSGTAPPSR